MASRNWREAATLILVSKSSPVSKSFKVLMMKRSENSKFMPNACVFPGGVVDKSDFNPKWKPLLERLNLHTPTWTPACDKPMIYQKTSSQDTSEISREVAFRINAIRETFEETGILLSVPNNNNNDHTNEIDPSIRERVHKNPSEFIDICKSLDICPDIWSLQEWSDWLTPLHLKTKSRFDTIFYIALADKDHLASAAPDGGKEVSEVQQYSPAEALELHARGSLWLAPPQFYEM